MRLYAYVYLSNYISVFFGLIPAKWYTFLFCVGMRGSRKFCQGGLTLRGVYCEGRENPNSTKSGCFAGGQDDGPILNAGLVAL